MTSQETSQRDVSPARASSDEIRAELYGVLDELGTARSDRTPILLRRFKELWSQIGEDREHTLH